MVVLKHDVKELGHHGDRVEFCRFSRGGEKACIMKSKVHITILFVTVLAGGVGVAVLACGLMWEGAAALGDDMVERGDWSSIHANSHRETYYSRNDFLFFVVPELSSMLISITSKLILTVVFSMLLSLATH